MYPLRSSCRRHSVKQQARDVHTAAAKSTDMISEGSYAYTTAAHSTVIAAVIVVQLVIKGVTVLTVAEMVRRSSTLCVQLSWND